MKQPILFAGVILLGMILGGQLAGHIFFGLILLGGLIALVENIPVMKWLVYKGNNILDVMIWGLSALAIITVGVTIAAALAVASLGYTMLYAPYVRKQLQNKKERNNKSKPFY